MNKIRKYGFAAALIVLAMTAVPPNGTGGYSLTFPLLKGAFASETASDAIIQEARNEAEKLLAVRSAVWLKFLDEWNAYLEERESAPDPTALTAPVFSSFTHLDDLLDKEGVPGYLPASFPVVNYSAVSLGNEIEVTVTPSNAVSATYVPNFLPMAEVSGGTVKLRITRPGASPEFGFFVEKNAVNAMGNGGTIEWLSGNGLVAANTLRGNTLSSQSGGPIAVSSPVNITGNTAVTGNLSATGTGTFTTMKANTIEGSTGTTITVAGALDLGANTITTTGAGPRGPVSLVR